MQVRRDRIENLYPDDHTPIDLPLLPSLCPGADPIPIHKSDLGTFHRHCIRRLRRCGGDLASGFLDICVFALSARCVNEAPGLIPPT